MDFVFGVLWLVVFCVMGLLAFLFLRPIFHTIIKYWLQAKLRRLPFVCFLCVGDHQFHCVVINGRTERLYADAPFMLVIKRESQILGVLGFETNFGLLSVYQMQGLKGVNVRGLDVSDYLLACAEEVAINLGLSFIRVQPARQNDYYDLGPEHSLYSQIMTHQARLRKTYDETPKRRGYSLDSTRKWYTKMLD